jgi:DNA-binding transcriptional ArsR family regulator
MTSLNASAEVLEACVRMASERSPVLRALGHPERLLIVPWLAGTSANVRELERVTGLPRSVVPCHLRALRDAGLVKATVEGWSNRYGLANPELDQLATLFGELEPASEHPVPAARR